MRDRYGDVRPPALYIIIMILLFGGASPYRRERDSRSQACVPCEHIGAKSIRICGQAPIRSALASIPHILPEQRPRQFLAEDLEHASTSSVQTIDHQRIGPKTGLFIEDRVAVVHRRVSWYPPEDGRSWVRAIETVSDVWDAGAGLQSIASAQAQRGHVQRQGPTEGALLPFVIIQAGANRPVIII